MEKWTVDRLFGQVRKMCFIQGTLNIILTIASAASAKQTDTLPGHIATGIMAFIMALVGIIGTSRKSTPILTVYLVLVMVVAAVTTGTMISNNSILMTKCSLKQTTFQNCNWVQGFNFTEPESTPAGSDYPDCLRTDYLNGDCEVDALEDNDCEAYPADVCSDTGVDQALFVLQTIVNLLTAGAPACFCFIGLIRKEISEMGFGLQQMQ
eukprot:TRINITY_DN7671_c0_g1::TRINITY_DN7671_c0_g1_i1::g.18591::m.18591 TRINITY_DN7671_c0_g1::TRINITY_DN7671_c0_g1_i1::g.18591  ORF type:complete len:209 (+),score=70.76,Tetraspannin/PF00335.15/0.00082,DUF1418/PF07214.7/0.036,DUF998/PF06197.8/0.16,DUF998/PF06197.8/2.5e+02 TRINITY_DN7671_c0_g1_i1:50-676(+)